MSLGRQEQAAGMARMEDFCLEDGSVSTFVTTLFVTTQLISNMRTGSAARRLSPWWPTWKRHSTRRHSGESRNPVLENGHALYVL